MSFWVFKNPTAFTLWHILLVSLYEHGNLVFKKDLWRAGVEAKASVLTLVWFSNPIRGWTLTRRHLYIFDCCIDLFGSFSGQSNPFVSLCAAGLWLWLGRVQKAMSFHNTGVQYVPSEISVTFSKNQPALPHDMNVCFESFQHYYSV